MDRAQLRERCHALPLFPLPGTVLMPGAALPLHVFEPRYRQLVKDCLAADGLLAIPQIRDGEEEAHAGHPGLYPYTTVGRITAHHELPDGRFNILVTPLGRVRITGELPMDHPYRMADATLLPDVEVPEAGIAAVGARLRAYVLPMLTRAGDGARRLADALREVPDARLVEAIAAYVLRDGPSRQAYLAEDDPGRRAEQVEGAVYELLGRLGLHGATAEA